MGEMQFVGGAIIFVFAMPCNNFSAMSLFMFAGFVSVSKAEFSQISFAVPGPTLENSLIKKDCNVLDSVALSIFINMPSSTPYGCGLISTGFGGSCSVALAKIICSAFGFV